MIRRTTSARHENEGGFTLVELLVVIVILGILSAVVVFAVRGASESGKGAAIATDERTIRTAQEAYCAKAGHYATMDQLTGAAPAADGNVYKFLSQPSSYHKLMNPPPSGSCNGSGFKILCRDGSDPPCEIPLPTTLPAPTTTLPELPPVGSWLRAGDLLAPSFRGVLLATDPGRIVLLGYGENGESSMYNAGDRSWLPATPVRELTGAVAIPGSPTPDCPNCGKVLVHRSSVTGPEWFLYDPLSQALVALPPNRHACRLGSALTPLADGKVLVSGCGASGAPTDLGPADSKRAEIFDARLPLAAPWKPVADMKVGAGKTLAVRLNDGRVLAVGVLGMGASFSKHAEIYDPGMNTWTRVTPDPSNAYHPEQASITLLPDGRVLLMTGKVGGPSEAELFNPLNNGWSQPVSCACPFGHSATLLASGRVLVVGGDSPETGYSQSATLFNPADNSWVPAASMPPPGRAMHGAVRLTGAACAGTSDCGKVLVAGGQTGYPGSPSTVLFSE